jgi:Tfp pilus assembly protein PilX
MASAVIRHRINPRSTALAPMAAQRGVVLFIALIVMVALSLAAVALIRSVDTTNAVIGNLGFRISSILPGNLAIEQAAAALFSTQDPAHAVHIADPTNDLPAENYFASWQNSDDARGVPAVLQKKSSASGLAKQLVDTSDPAKKLVDVTYVIERMCTTPGPATAARCNLVGAKQSLGETVNDPHLALNKNPYYRVTVRVDGPQNTASFLQATLR